jgi:hypothetical protein
MLLTIVVASALLIAATDIAHPTFADKNPQAQCINNQNQGFIGKEQSGTAYKFSKDTCQTLSR